MWICRKCNAEVEDNFEICWSCGTSVDGAQDPSFHPFASDEDVAGPPSSTNPASADKAVPIATYWVAQQAQAVQAMLEGAGVPVLVAYEFDPAGGTILLQVAEADVEKAQKLLAEKPQQTTPLPPAPPKPPEPDEETRYRDQPWLAPIPRDLSREETLRFLESQVSALIDSKDVPDWKVNPAFHPDVMAFIQKHANNVGFVQKAQGLQRNRAKYFATMRAQAQAQAARPLEEVFPEEPKPAKPSALAGVGSSLNRWLIATPLALLRRLLKLALYLVVVGLVLSVMGTFVYRGYGTKQLEDAVSETDEKDPGWAWEDLQGKRKEVPEKENAALVVLAAAKQVGDDWPGKDSPLRQIADTPNTQPLTAEQAKDLRAELDKQQAALTEARQLERFATGRYPQPVTETPLHRPAPWTAARPVCRLLALDAVAAPDADTALASCRAMLRAASAVGDEPDARAQLLRLAIDHQVCRSIERVLANGKASDDALALTQRALEAEASAAVLEPALRGHRAYVHESLNPKSDTPAGPDELALKPNVYAAGDLGGFERWVKTGWLNDNRARSLRTLSEAVALTKLPTEQQFPAFANWANQARQAQASDNLERYAPTATAWPAAEQLAAAAHRTTAELRALAVVVALERYRQAAGNWPATLESLTPKYLATVPLDLYDGQALRYRKHDGGITVYAVGPDATDDQGDLAGRKDVGITLPASGGRKPPEGQ